MALAKKRGILYNEDIDGSAPQSSRRSHLKPKPYDLMDYSDVNRDVTSKRYKKPNMYVDLKPD